MKPLTGPINNLSRVSCCASLGKWGLGTLSAGVCAGAGHCGGRSDSNSQNGAARYKFLDDTTTTWAKRHHGRWFHYVTEVAVSIPSQARREGAMPEAMQSQGLGTACRLLPDHRSAVHKNEEQNGTTKQTKNPKRTKINERQAPQGRVSFWAFHCLVWGVTFAARWHVHRQFKKNARSRSASGHVATYPYWSGWCIMGAWEVP